jgi:hypothetical protein
VGLDTKIAAARVLLVILFIVLLVGFSQCAGRFQSVGGDFGKNMINTFKNQTDPPAAAQDNKSGLWNWGKAPKGSLLKNGKILPDPSYLNGINTTNGLIKAVMEDPYTGNQIYSYEATDGSLKYFYVDPATGDPIYLDKLPLVKPTESTKGSYSLPPGLR